jgi:hypothetical protein
VAVMLNNDDGGCDSADSTKWFQRHFAGAAPRGHSGECGHFGHHLASGESPARQISASADSIDTLAVSIPLLKVLS